MTRLTDESFATARHAMPKRTAQLTQALEDLGRSMMNTVDNGKPTTVFDAAFRRMQDARPELPGAQAFDATKVSGTTSTASMPKGTLVKDPTNGDRLELDKRLRRLAADALWLRSFTERWSPKPATARERALAELTVDDVHLSQLCSNCVTHGFVDLEAGLSAEVHRHTDCGGALEHPRALCRWCMDFAIKMSKQHRFGADACLPDAEQLRLHYAGRRVPVRDVPVAS